MDKYHYCGAEYHPMPVYTHPAKPRIYVCHYRFKITDDNLEIIETDECKNKARYTFNRKLTPTR